MWPVVWFEPFRWYYSLFSGLIVKYNHNSVLNIEKILLSFLNQVQSTQTDLNR